mmetsp:Transcript_13481/g.38160  ORF Transcript_13481/g.38160 Transcript_13481/m.38160 type:complete len:249 (-) Transcript_13481:383-1129(-)
MGTGACWSAFSSRGPSSLAPASFSSAADRTVRKATLDLFSAGSAAAGAAAFASSSTSLRLAPAFGCGTLVGCASFLTSSCVAASAAGAAFFCVISLWLLLTTIFRPWSSLSESISAPCAPPGSWNSTKPNPRERPCALRTTSVCTTSPHCAKWLRSAASSVLKARSLTYTVVGHLADCLAGSSRCSFCSSISRWLLRCGRSLRLPAVWWRWSFIGMERLTSTAWSPIFGASAFSAASRLSAVANSTYA